MAAAFDREGDNFSHPVSTFHPLLAATSSRPSLDCVPLGMLQMDRQNDQCTVALRLSYMALKRLPAPGVGKSFVIRDQLSLPSISALAHSSIRVHAFQLGAILR